MKNVKFSLNIDETTDVSTIKQLVLLTWCYDMDQMLMVDKYLTLLEVKNCTALGIYNSIETFFTQHRIPFDNLIGFASDNASVMMGGKGGVQKLLKEKFPSLYIQGCICHSMNLCASKATSELPNYLEQIAKDIYSYFSNSPKRVVKYKKIQCFTNINNHKILRLSDTRWLSLER